MNNKFKNLDIKICHAIFFDDINIENFDLNKIEINETSFKNILFYCTGYVMFKDLWYLKINSENPLYLIVNKINRYCEETNGNKYLTLVPTDWSKNTHKKSTKKYGLK